MAPIDFYYMAVSSPCRSVMMLDKELDIGLNYKHLDMMTGEHLNPDFIKINPQHTVPTIDDNGFSLWESRSILMYLAEKFDKTGKLYPKDIQKRAHVQRMLFFDMEKIYGKLGPYVYSLLLRNEQPTEEVVTAMKTAFTLLDNILEGKTYATGDDMTIADLSIAASISFLQTVDYDLSEWNNIKAYLENMERLPYWEECRKSLDDVKEMIAKRAAAGK